MRLRQPAGERGIAVAALDPQLVRAVQHRRRRRRRQHRKAPPASARVSSGSPRPSGRRSLQHRQRLGPAGDQARPRCWTGCRPPARPRPRRRGSAWRARQHSPRSWPVTVTKPKLRIEAPLACASRSITTTRLPASRPPEHGRARRCRRRRRRDRSFPARGVIAAGPESDPAGRASRTARSPWSAENDKGRRRDPVADDRIHR